MGFEPTIGFPLCSVSNRVLSASQPRLRCCTFNGAGSGGQERKAAGAGEMTGGWHSAVYQALSPVIEGGKVALSLSLSSSPDLPERAANARGTFHDGRCLSHFRAGHTDFDWQVRTRGNVALRYTRGEMLGSVVTRIGPVNQTIEKPKGGPTSLPFGMAFSCVAGSLTLNGIACLAPARPPIPACRRQSSPDLCPIRGPWLMCQKPAARGDGRKTQGRQEEDRLKPPEPGG